MTYPSFSCRYTLAADILKLPNFVTSSTERQVCTVIPHFRHRNVPGEYTREVEGLENRAQVHSLAPDTSPLLTFSLLIFCFLEVPLLPPMSQN